MNIIAIIVFLILGIRGIPCDYMVVINDLPIPMDVYWDILVFNKKMHVAHCIGSFDETNLTYFEILNRLNSAVKANRELWCPVCNVLYPVGDDASDCFGIDFSKKYDSRICVDGLPYEVSYKLPAECIFCGGIFSKYEFDNDIADGLWEIWRPWYQEHRINNDKWKMYAESLDFTESESKIGLVYLFLRASRTFKNDNVKRKHYLEESLMCLDEYIEERCKIDNLENYNGSEKTYLLTIKADILRQCGKFKEAASMTAYLKSEIVGKYSYNMLKLDLLDKLIIASKDMPAIKPFGNGLHNAIRENLEINSEIEALITEDSKWQINLNGFSPLEQAIIEQRVDYVKLLTEEKYDIFQGIDIYGKTRWHALVKRINNTEITNLVENALSRYSCTQ